jgi:hypothetical protein
MMRLLPFVVDGDAAEEETTAAGTAAPCLFGKNEASLVALQPNHPGLNSFELFDDDGDEESDNNNEELLRRE